MAVRITLKDVARASGVSPTTVSFVLNNTPGQTIPELTRQRVRQSATELGYLPTASRGPSGRGGREWSS